MHPVRSRRKEEDSWFPYAEGASGGKRNRTGQIEERGGGGRTSRTRAYAASYIELLFTWIAQKRKAKDQPGPKTNKVRNHIV